jgi:hypothetical protein
MDRSRYKTRYAQIDAVAALKLTYDDGDLRIQGLDRGASLVVELRFRDVLLTRISPEGVRLRLLPELGTERGLVLTDEQSELITWVLEEGLHTRDMRQAKHFLVFVGEEIVDVVSLSEPNILKKQS